MLIGQELDIIFYSFIIKCVRIEVWLKLSPFLKFLFYLSHKIGLSHKLFNCWIIHNVNFAIYSLMRVMTDDSGVLTIWGNKKNGTLHEVPLYINNCIYTIQLKNHSPLEWNSF